ncbi:ABC transporter substrate-binding protein [Gordonia sp. SL306]|uniref:ABC transporter substrate-binding protein n=1 Tax=Gordonia sp. SL306 TaxID=2995145 RepID=UPI002271FB64|nr:ABC transporter substrate-binding protein [Gordonia sp. SL306]WAC57433.1 ABC transporter substrate-binding protein [Gordonia sp. SL306]
MTENTTQRFIRRPSPRRIRRRGRAALAVTTATVALSSALTGCGMFDSESVVVNVGYQSKTLNTVNAGTLMRDRGAFEAALDQAGEKSGKRYRVVWQDFSSGAPLTAAMIASHVDIGSMGDYPLLTNGSKTKKYDDAQTDFIATTGYNLRGSLNQVVVPTGSTATSLDDLRGKDVSTSLGSAGDGMLSTALERAGITKDDVHIANQDPSIGAAAVEGKQVDAFAQFVPWPQLVIFRNQGRLVYDGGDNEVPTFHGVVARHQFADRNPEVMTAFMQALRGTTDYITAQPMQAALRVSEITGIEPEVVYLYNGPNGLVSFDPTIKKQFGPALEKVKAYLVKRGSVSGAFDIARFTDSHYLEALYGSQYPSKTADVGNPSHLTGTDDVCGLPVADPATASEVWFADQQATSVAATPSCALRRIADTGTRVRAAYVPDAVTATKLFAAHATWLVDPSAPPSRRYLPFATTGGAAMYQQSHPGLTDVSYETALTQAGSTT